MADWGSSLIVLMTSAFVKRSYSLLHLSGEETSLFSAAIFKASGRNVYTILVFCSKYDRRLEQMAPLPVPYPRCVRNLFRADLQDSLNQKFRFGPWLARTVFIDNKIKPHKRLYTQNMGDWIRSRPFLYHLFICRQLRRGHRFVKMSIQINTFFSERVPTNFRIQSWRKISIPFSAKNPSVHLKKRADCP